MAIIQSEEVNRMKNSRRKNWGTLQYHISMKDQEFQLEPYSKRLFDVIKMGLLFAAALYVVLLVFELLTLIGSWSSSSFLGMQRLNAWICGGVFVLTIVGAFPRLAKRSEHKPEQLRFEDGSLCFRLNGNDVAWRSSDILGVNQHYRRNNLITSWMSVYDVRTAKGIYRLDLEDYAREVVVANYLLDCNRERNAEKVRKWQTAKQAFRTSDRVTFGTKRRLVVFEQQPPCMTIGHKRLELSSVRRIVVDPTVEGRGRLNIHVAVIQQNGKEVALSSLRYRAIEDDWDSFLHHLFAIARRANVPVELKTENRRDVSLGPSRNKTYPIWNGKEGSSE